MTHILHVIVGYVVSNAVALLVGGYLGYKYGDHVEALVEGLLGYVRKP